MEGAENLPEPLERLEERIGYRFRDRCWLAQAMTHRSHRLRDRKSAPTGDNELLEFLGDSVLGFLVSDSLCARLPHLREGKLSRIKANLVSTRTLRRVAEQLALGRYLLLGSGEEKSGGRQKNAILADAVEALVAALYRDGGLEAARRFVEEFVLGEMTQEGVEALARADYKSALQEYLQARRLPVARYQTTDARGPEHRKTFTVELWVAEQPVSRGEGETKKAAEQQAARQALERLPVLLPLESQ